MKNISPEQPSGITIRQVLTGDGKPRFVEYYSDRDSRNHIINAQTFCDNFGYQLDELTSLIKDN